jgi:hypothetical protein
MSSTHLEPKTRFLLLPDSCGFADVRRHLWREDGSALYNCCWSSPVQSFSDPRPSGLMTTFYCLRFEIPPTWKARSPYLYPPRKRVTQLYPQALGSIFVASYDSQGYSGVIRTRLQSGSNSLQVKVKVTLRLAVYLVKPFETLDQRQFLTETLRSWSLYNALSNEKICLSLVNMLDITSRVRTAHVACYDNYFFSQYASPLSVQALQSRSCLCILRYNGSLVTWTVVSLTTAKFKPLIFFTLTLSLESYITTDGESVTLSWNKAPIWGLRPDFYYCQTGAGLLMWGALSDERTDLSFTIAAGLRQRSHLDHILLSQIRDFPFRLVLRLTGLRWRYSTTPPHTCPAYNISARIA